MIGKLIRYLKFYIGADTIYNVHSPFVYDFITDVLDTSKEYYVFNSLEHERKILLSNTHKITIKDFGAGSKTNHLKERVIGELAGNVVSNKSKCRILFNLVNKFKPENILELGTSLGISALFMAKANSKSKITTIEGDPGIYKLARTLFEKNNLSNITTVNDVFENVLPIYISNTAKIDLAYIDGNHTYDATIYHFNMIKEKCHKDSIVIIDDIYWSEEMSKAWMKIKSDSAVTLSIDIFHMGFIFFNKDLPDKDVKWIQYYKKPYRIGLWG